VRKDDGVAAHTTGIAFAHCNPGGKAIGGGQLQEITGNEWIQRTGPAIGRQVAPAGSTPDTWFVRGVNAERSSQTITAFAVCVS
jgi:hypothetical protein